MTPPRPAPIKTTQQMVRGPLAKLAGLLLLFSLLMHDTQAQQLATYLAGTAPGDLVPGADPFGPQRADIPAVPALRGGKTIGWAGTISHILHPGPGACQAVNARVTVIAPTATMADALSTAGALMDLGALHAAAAGRVCQVSVAA